jgi:hypothetical protein
MPRSRRARAGRHRSRLDVVPDPPPDPQTAEPAQVSEHALYDTTLRAQPCATLGPSVGDHRLHHECPDEATVLVGVVTAVTDHDVRSTPEPTALSRTWRNGFESGMSWVPSLRRHLSCCCLAHAVGLTRRSRQHRTTPASGVARKPEGARHLALPSRPCDLPKRLGAGRRTNEPVNTSGGARRLDRLLGRGPAVDDTAARQDLVGSYSVSGHTGEDLRG